MPGYELMGQEELEAIQGIFEKSGGVLFAHGFDGLRNGIFHVRSFETEFAAKMGVQYAQAVNSGTAALKVALKALGVGPGDEVITQAFNFIADVEAILDVGARPVITQIDDSLNMNVNDLKERINPKTKAIILVHMLGAAGNLEEILKVAKDKGIPVIEDACEALGARWKGKSLGTFGDIGVFSLDFGKAITTGEGGMVVTNHEKYHRYAREYHDHGHENNPRLPRGRDTRTLYGFNYRMTELQGAIGRVQLKKLDFIVEENRKRYEILEKELSGVSWIGRRKIYPECTPLWDTFMFEVKDKTKHQKVLETVTKNGGTKNVPDALEWHCTAYWDHALEKKEVDHSMASLERLKEFIAVPINLKRGLEDYRALALKIKME